jgi:hypothetical protein
MTLFAVVVAGRPDALFSYKGNSGKMFRAVNHHSRQ